MEDINFGLDKRNQDMNLGLNNKPSKTKIKDSTPDGLFINPKIVCSDKSAKVC